MKSNRSLNWIYIALCWLGLTLLIIFLILPALAQGMSDAIGPGKLDVIPIPVPEPPRGIDKPTGAAMPSSLPSVGSPIPVVIQGEFIARLLLLLVLPLCAWLYRAFGFHSLHKEN